MRAVAAKPAPRRRSGLRWIVGLLIIVLLAAGAVVWLNSAAAAATNAVATLTVFLPATSVAHNGGDYAEAATGSIVQPPDGARTAAKGRAALNLPGGTPTTLADHTD